MTLLINFLEIIVIIGSWELAHWLARKMIEVGLKDKEQ